MGKWWSKSVPVSPCHGPAPSEVGAGVNFASALQVTDVNCWLLDIYKYFPSLLIFSRRSSMFF
jgi:hypothetical protein